MSRKSSDEVSIELEVVDESASGRRTLRHEDRPDGAPRVVFENLAYSVSSSKGPPCRRRHTTTHLLRNVTGYLRAGEVTAIMGSSGAGKTTLLDLLAKRKTGGTLEGRVLYDGEPRHHLSNADAGYVLQSDYALPNLTVREVMLYAARLRLPITTSAQEREERVDSILKELRLYHVRNSKVGDAMIRGISGGEMRRLSVAQELLCDPKVLFLDECTSGLDTMSAYRVIKLLKKVAVERNTAVVCSIHQPSSQIFFAFDRLLLLTKGSEGIGEMAFFGPVLELASYVEKLGYPCPPNMNIADHVLALVEHSLPSQTSERDLPAPRQGADDTSVEDENSDHEDDDLFEMHANVDQLLTAFQNSSLQQESRRVVESVKELPLERGKQWYPTPLWNQVLVYAGRLMIASFRTPGFFLTRVARFHVMGFFIATAYWQLSTDADAVQNKIGLLFFMMLSSFMNATSLLPTFILDRPLTVRERRAELYGVVAHMFGTLITMFPLEVINQLTFATYIYWATGLDDDLSRFLFFILIYVSICAFSNGYVLTVSAAAPTSDVATAVAPLLFAFMIIFSGFLILAKDLPPWWEWATYISPYRYCLSSALFTQFDNTTFTTDSNSNSSSSACGFQDGNQVLVIYNADLGYPTLWLYIGVMWIFAVASYVALFLVLRFRRWDVR